LETMLLGGTLYRPNNKIEICQNSVNELEKIFLDYEIDEDIFKNYMTTMLVEPFHSKHFIKKMFNMCIAAIISTVKDSTDDEKYRVLDTKLYQLCRLFAVDGMSGNNIVKNLLNYSHNLAVGTSKVLDDVSSAHVIAIRNIYDKFKTKNCQSIINYIQCSIKNFSNPTNDSQRMFVELYTKEMVNFVSDNQMMKFIKTLQEKDSKKRNSIECGVAEEAPKEKLTKRK